MDERIRSALEYIAREIIVVPQYFASVIEAFAKELPRLLMQATLFTGSYPFSQPRHVVNCILLSRVVRVRSDLKR